MPEILAYSYVRMSTDIQLKGDSLRRQVELSKKYAYENDLALVEDFVLQDIGVSAFKGGNVETGALGRFLTAVKDGEIPVGSYLLVESLDRLSRQKLDKALSLFFDITQSGINIVTLSDNQVYQAGNTNFAQLVYSIAILARANEESEIKSQRISAAWKNKRNNIHKKILTKTSPAWVKVSKDRTHFQPISDRVKIVRRIFQLATDGRGSYGITRILNKDGVPPFGLSHGWNESYVVKILKNRAVLGEFQAHSKVDGKRKPVGPPVEDYYPKIIDEDIYLKVQIARRERSVGGGGRRGLLQRNLFTHLAYCQYCGSPMRFVNKGRGPKGGTYLRCSASVRGMGCISTSWKYEEFEKTFFRYVDGVDLVGILSASAISEKKLEALESRKVLEERIASLKDRRNRILLLVSDAETSHDFIVGKLDELSVEIETYTEELTELDRQEKEVPAKQSIDSAAIEDLINSIQVTDGTTNVGEKRHLLAGKMRGLVRRIWVATEGGRPYFQQDLRQITGSASSSRSQKMRVDQLVENYQENVSCSGHMMVEFADGKEHFVPSEPTIQTVITGEYLTEAMNGELPEISWIFNSKDEID